MVSSKAILVAFCVCLLAERCGSKRGGLGMGRVGGGSSRSGMNMGRLGGSRGSSSSRSSSMGAGMTHGGSGGGLFGGGTRIGSHGSQTGSRIGGGGWNSQTGGGWNKNRGNQGGGSWAHGSSRGHIPRTSTYSKSGVGSFLRSNKFKNAIVGAAAGYLTYQAGKALIRSAVAPMMWNNRAYYWGSNYYPSSYPRSNMCRMPVDYSDPTFSNIYFQDGSTRPREIVWSCNYNEYCCGYECCPSGHGGWGWGHGESSSYWRLGIGSVVLTALLATCGLYLCCKFCRSSAKHNFLRPQY